jgi:hypothetical protein
LKSKYWFYSILFTWFLYRLDSVQQRRPPLTAPPRPVSALGFRSLRTPQNHSITSSNSNLNNTTVPAEATLLDENGLPLVGNLLAFTPDVIQAFQDAAKLIEESREIKKQAMNQIKDAFNDAKAYSLTVDQSIAQKLADIITLAVRKLKLWIFFSTDFLIATFNNITRRKFSCSESSTTMVWYNNECSTI